MRSLAAAAVVIHLLVVPCAPGDTATLARLESALAADVDNLRAGSEYRMAIIEAGDYDRALAYFESLAASHPDAANLHLNYGFAYVDKIPAAGAITQVILANKALTEFSRALDLRPSWIAYYTRGNSYLYWPKIFDRTRLGIADLEHSLELQRADRKHAYYVRTFIALGDGHWMMDDEAKARATWRQGLDQFRGDPALEKRLRATPPELKALIGDAYDPTRRVNTNLEELWTK